jgi:prepilin-type N-terminal cleavage/methylation domain-containing protein
MKSCKDIGGVTLIEMLIVLAVLSLLVGLVLNVATGLHAQANEKLTRNTFGILETALQAYRDFTGDFPRPASADPNANSEFLYQELDAIPGSRKVLENVGDRLIQDRYGPPGAPEIYDAWGTVLDYIYLTGDTFPRLVSAGPDRDFSTTADNLTNR